MVEYNKMRREGAEFRVQDSQNLLTVVLCDPVCKEANFIYYLTEEIPIPAAYEVHGSLSVSAIRTASVCGFTSGGAGD